MSKGYEIREVYVESDDSDCVESFPVGERDRDLNLEFIEYGIYFREDDGYLQYYNGYGDDLNKAEKVLKELSEV